MFLWGTVSLRQRNGANKALLKKVSTSKFKEKLSRASGFFGAPFLCHQRNGVKSIINNTLLYDYVALSFAPKEMR